ncbi:MAG: DUF302 domain-containing protein [Arachnia sp.]
MSRTNRLPRNRPVQIIAGVAAVGLLAVGCTAEETEAGDVSQGAGIVTVDAQGSVEEVADRITAAIEEAGPSVFTTIDHAENAANADLELPPTTLILFGAPPVGTPLMQQQRTIGMDLPQKVLVYEGDDGETVVTWNDPEYLFDRHGIEGMEEQLETIQTLFEGPITGAATGE